MRILVFLLMIILPMRAAETAADELRRERAVAAEVQRRRALREAETSARAVVRDHESGAKPATEAELDAARAVIRDAEERRAKAAATPVARKTAPPAGGGATPSQQERFQQVAVEVQRRRVRREEAEASAQALVRDHESGAKPATEAQLAVARTVIHEADVRRTNAAAVKTGGREDLVQLKLPGADMATVAAAWRTLFGGETTIGERVKSRTVWFETPAVPRSEVRSKLIESLGVQGVSVTERTGGVVFDAEPAAKSER